MNALTVRGPFHGPTGYDRHVREFVREFHRQGVRIELIDFPGWSPARLPEALRDPWFDTLGEPCDSHTVLHFSMPHQVVRTSGKNNVNFTMFEATRVPGGWIEANRRHEMVVVPTESSRRAWMASGMPEHRIRTCPLGINPGVFNGSAPPLPLCLETGAPVAACRTRFLTVAESSPRKNLQGLLEAWTAATSPADDAVLIVKPGCYRAGSQASLHMQLESLRNGLRGAAPVHFVHDVLPDGGMPSLYAAASHYIGMSFGEGWDQAMMEAAASGLRLIAPDHSAYREYLDPTVATLIPCREVPAQYGGDPATAMLFRDANWWEPDRGHAIAAIRSAIAGGDATPAAARDRVLANYTWEQATRRLIAILEELESLRAKIPMLSVLRGNTTPASGSAPDPPAARQETDRR